MVSYHTSRRRYFPTNSDTIHGWYIPSMDRRPVGGKLAAMRYKVETMENPTIHGNPYLPWMVGIHEWDATERHALLSQLRISNNRAQAPLLSQVLRASRMSLHVVTTKAHAPKHILA